MKNEGEKIFPRFARTDRRYAPLCTASGSVSYTVPPPFRNPVSAPARESHSTSVPLHTLCDTDSMSQYVTMRTVYIEHCISWSFALRSTLSLILNIVTAHPVSSQVVVTVSYASYKTFNPYWFPGYAGRLARLQQAKEILDGEVHSLVALYWTDR